MNTQHIGQIEPDSKQTEFNVDIDIDEKDPLLKEAFDLITSAMRVNPAETIIHLKTFLINHK